MKLIALFLMTLFITTAAHAGSSTNVQKLTFVRTGYQSNVLVVVGGANDFTSNEGCNGNGNAALKPDTEHAEEIYAQILSAYLTKTKVRFYGNGCVSADSTEYINIQYVYFNDSY